MGKISLAANCSLFAFATIMACSPALAQPADGDAPAAAADGDEEILITAQRREERSTDVPITVTNLTSERLDDANVQELGDIAKVTPGLRFDATGSFTQPTIRGIGTALIVAGGGANVGIYVDGFYSPNPLVADMQLMNLRSIQVLKGPQGSLFGRNTTGGAILLTTARPSTEPMAIFAGSYGSYDALKVQGYATFGLTDKIAVDAEGLWRSGRGYVKNILTGRNDDGEYANYSIRLGLNIELTDNISILLRYIHQRIDDPTTTMTNAFVLDGQALTVGRTFAAPFATRPNEVASDEPNRFFHLTQDVFQGTLTADLGFADLTSYTQYRKESSDQVLDLDASAAPVYGISIPVFDKTFSQEFLLISKPGPRLQWTAGLFYFNYKDHFAFGASRGIFGAGPSDGPFVPFADSGATTRSIAGFADFTYQATDQLFITLGARYSHDEIRNAFFTTPGTFWPSFTYVSLPTLKKNTLTPRFVVRYKPSETSSVYASVTRGYKTPIYNVGGQTSVPVKAESITAFEVGYKYGTRRLSFDVASYYYIYKDFQFASYTGTASLISNAPKARVYGAEAQLRYRFADGFELNAGAAYTNAKYVRFPDAPSFIITATGCENFFCAGNTTVDASGNEMQRAPKLTANLGLRYTTDVMSGKLNLSGNVYYTSRLFFDPDELFRQKGYALVNLRAEWTHPSERVSFAVFADNLTDKDYVEGLTTTGGLAIQALWGAPRTVGASVRFKLQ